MGPKRKGFKCPSVLRIKRFFNGRVIVEKGGGACDHTPSGEERKYRLYSSETKEMLQEAVQTNLPAKHIRNKLLNSGAVGEEVNTLKGRRSIYQKTSRWGVPLASTMIIISLTLIYFKSWGLI